MPFGFLWRYVITASRPSASRILPRGSRVPCRTADTSCCVTLACLANLDSPPWVLQAARRSFLTVFAFMRTVYNFPVVMQGAAHYVLGVLTAVNRKEFYESLHR